MIAPLELARWYPALAASPRALRLAGREREPSEHEILVCVGRRRPSAPRGSRLRRWACFPGTGGGFVMLAADHAGVFRAGAQLLPGGRALTRIAGRLVRASSRLGLHAQLAPERLALVERDDDPERALHRRFAGLPAELEWNVASGVPGRDQKTTVQLVTRAGEVVAYAKLGLGAHARARVAHEARTLERLRDLGLDAPRPLGCELLEGSALLVQSPAPGERASGRLATPHRRYLDALERATGCRLPLERIPSHVATLAQLACLEARAEAAWITTANELARALERATAGRPLRCALAHGDFTPWNVVLSGARAVAFDWEHARELAPRLFDALHFTLQQAVLVDRTPHAELYATLEARVGGAGGAGDDDWLAQLGVYLLDLAVADEAMQLEQRSPFVQVDWLRDARLALMRELVLRLRARGARAA